MQCDLIVLLNLSTMDSREELEENRKSLRAKYESRGTKCIPVDFPGGSIPSLKGTGKVGVYVLSHTKDVKALTLAQDLWKQLFEAGADVRKISIACCRGATGEGPMKPFCTALAACQTDKVKLPVGLMVCGFTVNVTTFDNNSEFMDKEGIKFQNYKELKDEATQRGRTVATVKQSWGTRGSDEPNFLSFVHERMGKGATPTFIVEAEKLFREQLAARWRAEGVAYIRDKFNAQKKPSQRITDPENWTWGDFAGTHPDDAGRYIKQVFWPQWLTLIKGVNHRSAAMWSSLDGYMKMKTAMKFDGRGFVPIALGEYTDNPDMKSALSFVDGANKSKGATLRCLVD